MAEEKETKIIKVDEEACIGCGSCESIAPEHFELDSDGKSKVLKQYKEEDKDIIQEAIDGCPVGAISVVAAEQITEEAATKGAEA